MEEREEKKETKEKSNKKDLIIKIILIIIIVLLLLHNCVMLRKNKSSDEKTPTGNVDIFEISCKQDKCINPDTKGKDEDKNENKNDNGNKNTKENEIPVKDNSDITILDNRIIWESENRLRIFENPVFNFNEIIAPESSNVYQFVIKNTTDYKIKYNVDFVENNEFNINMKYKVKRNDEYIISEYVSASELNLSEFRLNEGESDTFYLEWKWISSSNDTKVGNNPNSYYKLSIQIKAESI